MYDSQILKFSKFENRQHIFELTKFSFNCAFWPCFRRTDDFEFQTRRLSFDLEFEILVRHDVVQFLSSRGSFTVFETLIQKFGRSFIVSKIGKIYVNSLQVLNHPRKIFIK